MFNHGNYTSDCYLDDQLSAQQFMDILQTRN